MLNSVSFLEFIDASAGIDELLSSRKERMAFAANIHFQNLYVFGRARFERFATSAYHGYFVIIRMNIRLHTNSPRIVFFRILSYYNSVFPVRQLILKVKRKNLLFFPKKILILSRTRPRQGELRIFSANCLQKQNSCCIITKAN